MRCAVFLRVSTDKEEQKTSLKNQKDLFYHYVNEKGWDIAEEYIDVESGTIPDAKQNRFDVILAKELSRLARNGGLSYQIRDLCEMKGIHIITLDNAINTLEGNTHMFGLYAWLYEQESQRTSDRIKSAIRTKAQKGIFTGSIPPYGYSVINGKLFVRDDNTPAIVKRIFKEYLSGSGVDSIARRLYNDGIPTPGQVAKRKNAGDKWNGSTIKLILLNPHYIGDLVQGRETTRSVVNKKRQKVDGEDVIIYPDVHEAIISREDFNTVQDQMKIRTRNITSPKKHLYTNVVFCADCGKGMWYRQNRQGYICGNYARHGGFACSSHSVKEDTLNKIILDDIKELTELLDQEEHLKQLDTKVQKVLKKESKEVDKIDSEENLMSKKRKYIDLLADSLISKEEYKDVTEANNKKLDMLYHKKNELENKINSQEQRVNIQQLQKELSEFLGFKELTPEILHRLVSKIEIKEDGSPIIYYRFSDPSLDLLTKK